MKKLLIGVIVFVMALSFTLPLYAAGHGGFISDNASETGQYNSNDGRYEAYYSPGIQETIDRGIGRYRDYHHH